MDQTPERPLDEYLVLLSQAGSSEAMDGLARRWTPRLLRYAARVLGGSIETPLEMNMFWFPAPDAVDPRATAFLAIERQYVTGPLTSSKVAMTALVPVWFIALAWAFWRGSWALGFMVISLGTALKVIWSFYFGGDSAWAIVPPVALGFVVCAGSLLYAHRRVRHCARAGVER